MILNADKIGHKLHFGGLFLLLLCGCQSPMMKGTPFYTGEYEGTQAHIERINLWPVLYYRDPALSILWPVFEITDDHNAVRPIFSVYNKTDEKPVYNMLWPLIRFDTKKQHYHIFPFFWGRNATKKHDEYFIVAPLYAHMDDPFIGHGKNILFPLWIWDVDENERELHLFWPIYASKTNASERLWRLWPLYGYHSEKNGRNVYRFWAAGLIGIQHKGEMAETTLLNGSRVLPFYAWKRDTYFYTILYGEDQTKSYYMTPLIGRYHTTRWNKDYIDCKGGWVFPLWWHKESDKYKTSGVLLGLWQHYKSDTRTTHGLFPIYYSKVYERKLRNSDLLQKKQEFRSGLLFSDEHRQLLNPKGKIVEEHFSTGLFPLWHQKKDIPRESKNDKITETKSLLLRLYDYRCETPRTEGSPVYTRHRILWRLYHKETLGENSSADIFPAIAIDRKENGFRKYSLLWRLFRYEKDPETGTSKLDILFIPLKR